MQVGGGRLCKVDDQSCDENGMISGKSSCLFVRLFTDELVLRYLCCGCLMVPERWFGRR
jgi:hypothetical protein